MNAEELKKKLENLSIWKKGDQRAPHKPLLILYALGQLMNKQAKILMYSEVNEDLRNLLKEFGPPRQSYHPEHPFVRLVKDGVWKLNTQVEDKNITDKWLKKHEVVGGFTNEVNTLLSQDHTLVREVAELVLTKHFPETVQEDILAAVGLDFSVGKNRGRDPKFRDRILRAYEHSCAVCGFNVRLGTQLIAVEAAHIKWHQAGGPDIVENGVALCAMHHKLFDRGAFTINKSHEFIVTEEAYGTNGFEEWLNRYHGKQIRRPIHPQYQPNESFIEWHVREVFRGQERYRVSD